MHNKYSQKLVLFLATTLLIWSGTSFGYSATPDTNDSKLDFFHTFSNDMLAELTTAKTNHKFGALLFFSTPDCRFCNRMKATVFNQPAVQRYFRQHFQLIEINIELDKALVNEQNQPATYKTLAGSHRVRLTPTIVFLDTNGQSAYRHVGMIADPQEFQWLGEYVMSGQTQKQSFSTFKMKKRQHK